MEKIAINDLSIEVRRSSKRKTIELTVDRDGRILLYAPATTDTMTLEMLVKERRLWIYQKLGRKDEELHALPQKEYVSGEGFHYLGRKYRLKVIDDPLVLTLKFRNGRFLMPPALTPRGHDLFIQWYTHRAMEWISRRISMHQARVGVAPQSVGVQDLGYRWGSCTQKGKLFFHWRIILLPPERIDYLILHELVHIHEHNHSPAFYDHLRRVAPEYEAHEEWLRRNGDVYNI
ncbi:M48 family metallopeptidase [Trichlorobacter lovleyi]|uniref:M48 family metallopeptidase n=1 Tax=Trichlorobacter lovleyi TaxID=313985 RepID=UPI0023F3B162|nr:SprT family zinc-dependent metalloprotease [Trichlorobacter lovleyi]